jgi:hypothetical protein
MFLRPLLRPRPPPLAASATPPAARPNDSASLARPARAAGGGRSGARARPPGPAHGRGQRRPAGGAIARGSEGGDGPPRRRLGGEPHAAKEPPHGLRLGHRVQDPARRVRSAVRNLGAARVIGGCPPHVARVQTRGLRLDDEEPGRRRHNALRSMRSAPGLRTWQRRMRWIDASVGESGLRDRADRGVRIDANRPRVTVGCFAFRSSPTTWRFAPGRRASARR